MIGVAHHGVHWGDDGIAYLQQGLESQNAIGWKDPSPFQVMRGCAACNHRINLSRRFEQLEQHPLFQLFYPLPKTDFGIYYIVADQLPTLVPLLHQLTGLSSPIKMPLMPIWTGTRSKLTKQLFSTNVQTMVLTDVAAKHMRLMNEAVQLASSSPSKLVLVGRGDVPVGRGITRIDPQLSQLPKALPDMKRMGATAIWRYMRGE